MPGWTDTLMPSGAITRAASTGAGGPSGGHGTPGGPSGGGYGSPVWKCGGIGSALHGGFPAASGSSNRSVAFMTGVPGSA